MDDFSGGRTETKITVLHDTPLSRAKAISGLISEERLLRNGWAGSRIKSRRP
jgi:hypothetical protein